MMKNKKNNTIHRLWLQCFHGASDNSYTYLTMLLAEVLKSL